MKKVYTNQNLTYCDLVKGILEMSRIPAILRNEHFCSSVAGGIGFGSILIWPEVWILDEEDMPKAEECLKQSGLTFLNSNDVVADKANKEDSGWTCPECNENVPSSFEVCWNCGAIVLK